MSNEHDNMSSQEMEEGKEILYGVFVGVDNNGDPIIRTVGKYSPDLIQLSGLKDMLAASLDERWSFIFRLVLQNENENDETER